MSNSKTEQEAFKKFAELIIRRSKIQPWEVATVFEAYVKAGLLSLDNKTKTYIVAHEDLLADDVIQATAMGKDKS